MQQPLERRRFGRRNSCHHAWIEIPGRPRIACTISNSSHIGAFLQFDVPNWLPLQFKLVPGDGSQAIVCELRHRTLTGIGVHFVGSYSADLLLPNLPPQIMNTMDWMGNRPASRPTNHKHPRK